jgi:mRNA-degrading endonuclease RelE of RelBE toxin-antitoxin system
MVDKIEKALKKLTEKERRVIKNIFINIQREKTQGLDLKKLKGHNDIFRVRRGRIRIVFRKNKESILILSVERRSDKTCKGL